MPVNLHNLSAQKSGSDKHCHNPGILSPQGSRHSGLALQECLYVLDYSVAKYFALLPENGQMMTWIY